MNFQVCSFRSAKFYHMPYLLYACFCADPGTSQWKKQWKKSGKGTDNQEDEAVQTRIFSIDDDTPVDEEEELPEEKILKHDAMSQHFLQQREETKKQKEEENNKEEAEKQMERNKILKFIEDRWEQLNQSAQGQLISLKALLGSDPPEELESAYLSEELF